MTDFSDSGNYFQTATSLESAVRRNAKASNNDGSPLQLSSKILTLLPAPTSVARSGSSEKSDDEATKSQTDAEVYVYVAESAGTTPIVSEKIDVFRGPTAPVSSLAFRPPDASDDNGRLFAGSWDKSVWAWSITFPPSPQPPSAAQQYPRPASEESSASQGGHKDFVKSILFLRLSERDLLVTGGADADILVWDVQSGRRIQVLRGHTRAVLTLALDPVSSSADEAVIFSGGSEKGIRRWKIRVRGTSPTREGHHNRGPERLSAEIPPSTALLNDAHETSIHRLVFDLSPSGDADLYTASADGSAKCLSRERKWEVETTMRHPDFVRDVCVDEQRGRWVVTGCRDEEIRVWIRGTSTLYATLSGHYSDVTSLCIVILPCFAGLKTSLSWAKSGVTVADSSLQTPSVSGQATTPPIMKQQYLISASLDGTIRRWSLDRADLKAMDNTSALAADGAPESPGAAEAKDGTDNAREMAKDSKDKMLTADEERELEALMADD
ncbi:MAG: hypothetical protein M1817_005185 [Caeruleum heppii]|nr:MAG: hypothetical protein M1817_005185 [Caeruleum heppii]